MTYGLHLNSRGTKKLEFLTVKSSGDKNVSGTSRIPVIASERAALFKLKAKTQSCLKYIDCFFLFFMFEFPCIIS